MRSQMSELADILERAPKLNDGGIILGPELLARAIAALRSEPVADSITRRRKEWEALEIALQAYLRDYEYGDEGYVPTDNEKYMLNDFWNGALSNEAIILALRHVYPIRKLYAAPSREQDRRESNSNPAPVHGQSKTGLTESHSGAPTPTAETTKCPTCKADHWVGCYLNGCPIRPDNADPSKPEAEPALSAETIKAVRKHWDNCSDVVALCNMALSSLTARHTDEDIAESYRKGHEQGALTARDEGIEAVLNDEALHLSDRQRSRVRNLKGQP